MPYLRLYSRDMPIDEKRLIAQKLIEITRRTFNMPSEKPNRITGRKEESLRRGRRATACSFGTCETEEPNCPSAGSQVGHSPSTSSSVQ
jgi:hypothetical protein